ncbi:AAA family ATPase [Candidatus Parcubacteria bacterium]|nr:AAA family ATPase [Candidatus Parcubacteria bacterium]
MTEEKQQNSTQFIVCPSCSGTGKKRHGLTCSNCAGMGVGTFYRERFFYWGPKFSTAYIKLSHLRRGCHLILNLAGLTIGLIGVFALGWWMWLTQNLNGFWQEQHWLILIFWLSVIAWMFIIYRLSQEEALKHKISKAKYDEKNKQYQLPNNWEELTRIKHKYKVDVSQGFDYSAMEIVEDAFILANDSKHTQVQVMHLFFSLLTDKEVTGIFSRLNVNSAKLLAKIKSQLIKIKQEGDATILSNRVHPVRYLSNRVNPTSTALSNGVNPVRYTVLSNGVKEALVEAYLQAESLGQKKVKAINFILPCMAHDKILYEILYDLEVDQEKINNVIAWFRINERLLENYKTYRKAARFKPASAMDRAYTAVATPVLNHFSHDLTIAAKWGKLELCVGRDKEIENIFQAVESSQSGVILIGPNGVGKDTIIGGIAQLMVEEDVPKILKDKRLIEMDVARLISGASPAQAEQRLLVAIDEITRAGNIILYIDNIENLIGITAGAEESLDLSEVLVSALDRQGFYCFASATSQNYLKYIENTSIGNVMAKVEVEEPSGNQAIQMVESKIGMLENKYKVYFSYNAIEQTIKLAGKYIHDKYLPDKAIDILESVAVKVAKTRGEQAIVAKGDVAKIISEITRIPVTKVTESESEILLKLEEKIHERMINQEEAVNMVSASLRRARIQLRESKRPIANFLFLGPTGVGKTELAKTVSEVYFGDEDYMIRLDMSEYQHPDSVKKMIGDATGTRGYLTEQVRKSPFSLILLDEFEKSHPNILNLFLQVMDDGRLTDGQGRTIDFTSSIIIATSNVGAVFIQEQITAGIDVERIKQVLIDEHLNKVIRPELINRFDGVIVFKPLSRANVVDISKLMLNNIGKMLETKGIGLRVEEEGACKLAEQGFDPKFGARPLRRLLQEKVENIIANKILAGELKRRDTVVIDADGEVLVEKGREL